MTISLRIELRALQAAMPLTNMHQATSVISSADATTPPPSINDQNLSPSHHQHHHHNLSPYTQQIPSPITASTPNNHALINNNNKYMQKYMHGTDSHMMYHSMASPTYSPDHSSNILSYSIMSPGMLNEHDIKIEGMHGNGATVGAGTNNHHTHSHHHHMHHGHSHNAYHVATTAGEHATHDSRSPSLDGDGNADHLHEMQSQQRLIAKMERPSVVNIKTE